MAVNSSSPSLNLSQNSSNFGVTVFIAIVFMVMKFFLILPLSILVLYLGLQRWRQQRSFATASHSDIFTYHSAAAELMYMLGAVIQLCGLEEIGMGSYFASIVLPAVTSLNILTCVERYLAVVHPVVYLGLRQSGGVRIRNISIGCVWLLCLGWTAMIFLYSTDFCNISYLCFLALSIVVVSFCSLSVLRVLIRPGPGGKSRDRPRVDKSKQRAFFTVTAILGVLWVCFLGYLVSLALAQSHVFNNTDESLVLMVGYCCSLPSSLVLPVLFLQRTGKMPFCQK